MELLLSRRGEANPEGQGYFEIAKALALFEDVFNNAEDFLKTAVRLVVRQLVEVDTKSTEGIEGARCFRITSAGWYYLRFLIRSFCYLDLVLQDTPITDEGITHMLRESVRDVDNMYDDEAEKMGRVEARFRRVEVFLDYLENEEESEHYRFNMEGRSGIFGHRFLPEIRAQYLFEKERIVRRIFENREKYEQESVFEMSEEEVMILGSVEQEDAQSAVSGVEEKEM